jgi:hypothetical protein
VESGNVLWFTMRLLVEQRSLIFSNLLSGGLIR